MSTAATTEEKKRVLVPIADGSEEIETTCITDTLTRFGADVTMASVKPDGELVCTMSRNIKFQADTTIEEASQSEWDLIVLPGGMPGSQHLSDSPTLITLLQSQKNSKKPLGAICAAPSVVLASHDLLDASGGYTCYPAPGLKANMVNYADEKVVVKDNVITSQGPGTALEFGLALGEILYGKEKADEIAGQMLVDR